ncbi:MAG: hypothetical protein ACI8Q6_002518, partial [Granulosicoccus sp.]
FSSTKRTARARTSVEKRFPEFPFVMTYLPSFTLSGKPGLVQNNSPDVPMRAYRLCAEV